MEVLEKQKQKNTTKWRMNKQLNEEGARTTKKEKTMKRKLLQIMILNDDR